MKIGWGDFTKHKDQREMGKRELLSVSAFAKLCGISQQSVAKLIDRGVVEPAYEKPQMMIDQEKYDWLVYYYQNKSKYPEPPSCLVKIGGKFHDENGNTMREKKAMKTFEEADGALIVNKAFVDWYVTQTR